MEASGIGISQPKTRRRGGGRMKHGNVNWMVRVTRVVYLGCGSKEFGASF